MSSSTWSYERTDDPKKRNNMKHLPDEFVDKAKKYSINIGASVRLLQMFGVVGFLDEAMHRRVYDYLKHKLETEVAIGSSEPKGLIWCRDTVGERLDRVFSNFSPPMPRRITQHAGSKTFPEDKKRHGGSAYE